MPELISANYIILTVGIMIISGTLGGMVSALLSARDDQQFLSLIIKHILIGMVSALTVPLILNVLSSDLLDSGQTKPLKLLTVSGLCILFGVFSPGLLERVYGNRSKDEMRHGRGHHQEAGNPERLTESAAKPIPANTPDRSKALENQSRILRALADAEDAKLILADLLKSTDISQKDFDETLSLLMAKGAIAQELSTGSKLQLVLTTRGRQQLNKMSAN